MDKNKAFFLKCLADFLNGKSTDAQEDIDWEVIYDFALKHQMINIILHQCEKFMDSSAFAKFQKSGKYALFYRMKIESAIEVIKGICQNLKIEYAFVKGPVVAPFYSVPEYRSMGDIDIVVPTPERQRVSEAFLQKGFNNKSQNDEHEWVFTYNGIEVELHDKLIYKEVFNDEKQDEFLNNMWGYVKDGEMDKSFHFIYLLHHLKKHLTSSGAGFRQFFDIACVIKNCRELDWNWILETLEKLNMTGFAQLCFGLCEKWFNLDTNLASADIDGGFYESATDKIFENGVFGFSDEDNRFNMSVNRVNAGGNRFFEYALYVLKNIFPGYKAMSAMNQYAFLRNKPFLLPIAWIYRIFWGIKNGQKKRFKRKIDSAFVSKDKLEKRSEEMKKWKLN